MNGRVWVAMPMLLATGAHASEWTAAPQLYTRAEYADNPRLSVDAQTVDGSVTDASLVVKRRTEDTELALAPAIQYREYSGDDTLDGSDEFARLAFRQRGERQTWNVDLNWSRQSTLTTELGTTGFTETNKQRQDVDAAIGAEYRLSDRMTVEANVAATDTRYLNARWTGLVDYRYYTTSAGLSRFAGERLELAVNAGAGRLDVPDLPDADTLQYGLTAQAAYAWTPQYTLSAFAGPSRVEGDEGTDDGIAFGVTLNRNGERSFLSASLSRSVQPTGRGVLVRRDALSIGQRFRLSERLTLELNANALRSVDAEVRRQQPDEVVEYRYVDVVLAWDWSPHLRSRFTVGRNTQRSDVSDYEAHGYTVSLGFSWTPAPMDFWH